MANNNERVEEVLDIYRETHVGLQAIRDTYEMGDGFAAPKNLNEAVYEAAIQDNTEEAVRFALEGGESTAIDDVVKEGLGWFRVEAKRKLGNVAYSLFVAKQNEKVESLLAGTCLRATSLETAGFGAIMRDNGYSISSSHRLEKQVTAPFYKADTNLSYIILRQEATDDMLDAEEIRHKLVINPESFKHIYWIVNMFGGQEENIQRATIEIVDQ
ncbi:MAG TPA: hypothetical protein VF401_04355 [Candidatus Saccharimonadales bacterium]